MLKVWSAGGVMLVVYRSVANDSSRASERVETGEENLLRAAVSPPRRLHRPFHRAPFTLPLVPESRRPLLLLQLGKHRSLRKGRNVALINMAAPCH